MTKNEELIWAAGLLEGQGSFCVGADGQAKVCMTMHSQDMDIVYRLQSILGGKVSDNGKRLYAQWYLNVAEIVPVVTSLRPYMGTRRKEQIDKVLARREEIASQPPKKGGGSKAKWTGCDKLLALL